MKKCCCFLMLCQLFLWVFSAVSAWADENQTGSSYRPVRVIAISPPVDISSSYAFNSPVVRNPAAISGTAVAREVARQRLELSPRWSLESSYNYYNRNGWFNSAPWASADKAEVYALYHLDIFSRFSPYFRVGVEWLQERYNALQSGLNRAGDAIGFHVGGGIRFGKTKNIALDLDASSFTPVGSSTGYVGGKRSDFSWGGSIALVYYF